MSVHELQLVRNVFLPQRTAGVLTYDGKSFGYVVEDPDRGREQGMTLEQLAALKVPGATAIATGIWPIVLRDSPKFGPDTLTVLCQGNRLVRIHVGNDEADTEACICPGLGLVRDGAGVVTGTERSTPAVRWLHEQLRPQLRAGGEAWLRITREPIAWAHAPFNPAAMSAAIPGVS